MVNLSAMIKESEDRNDKAHGELSARIDNGFGRVNDNLLKVSVDVGYLHGRRDGERDARNQQAVGGPKGGHAPAAAAD